MNGENTGDSKTAQARSVLLDGSPHPPPEQILLRAGALDLIYEDGTLRHIKLGDVDVVNQIYAAVRDHNWGTVAGEIHDFALEQGDDHFKITFTMQHQQNDIDFVWHGSITGTPDSTITFDFDGTANSTFKRNRIGFCVLHPMSIAGQTCIIEHTDDISEHGQFPDLIAPHQPYFDIRAIQHEVHDGVQARVLMEGDTFEMEDQRNWLDASYKTYCTPLGVPFPATVNAGDRIQQKITLTITGDHVHGEHSQSITQTPRFTLNDETHTLPKLGLSLPSHGELPDEREAAWLKALNLSHLRADVKFSRGDAAAQMQYAARYARALNTAIELALFLTDNADVELSKFTTYLKTLEVMLARIMIFHEGEKSTSRRWVELARKHFDGLRQTSGAKIPIGAGTDAFFTELNREQPPADLLNFVTYSLNPQVHAFDNLSLVETLPTHAPTVETARHFSDGADIVVSPVTFKMRWNPNATGEPPPIPEGELPPQVDPRQMSLFGAGWTLGSIKYLAQSDVTAATYYETTGWRGVMETANGASLPQKFPSQAGTVFPMYHVFRALGDYHGGEVITSRSSQPLTVDGLALRKGNQTRIILANYTGTAQSVTVAPLTTNSTIRVLDAASAAETAGNPDAFWSMSGQPLDGDTVTLPPYAVVFLDQADTTVKDAPHDD